MICLVYVSSAIRGLSKDDINSIVKASEVSNRILNITGLLLYKGGNFMQLIEGDSEIVHILQSKIKDDIRHTGMITLLSENITHRNFENWSMGYQDIDFLMGNDRELIKPLIIGEFDSEIYRKNPYRALALLKAFKKNMR